MHRFCGDFTNNNINNNINNNKNNNNNSQGMTRKKATYEMVNLDRKHGKFVQEARTQEELV